MPKRIRIVSVPAGRGFPHEVGDEPIVADHVAEAWIGEGTAEPYEEPVERAVSEPDAERAVSIDDMHVGGGWYELPSGERVRGKEAAREALEG